MVETKCVHLDRDVTPTPNTDGCEECLATDGKWVHLRLCRTCGHVGCCDSSPGKHSTKHFVGTSKTIITFCLNLLCIFIFAQLIKHPSKNY